MLLTILLLMMNSRTKHYVISFISKFNLLFLVALVMFKKKNEKKTNKFLTYCVDKKIKNLVVREIKFRRKLANFATAKLGSREKTDPSISVKGVFRTLCFVKHPILDV